MLKLGITGEMGSGKSHCSKILEKLDIPVFYSDDVAKSIVNSNINLRKEIYKEFGNVYDEDGMIIPHLMRDIVFIKGGEQKLEKLNDIVHPYVFERYNNFCELNKDKKYTLIESAILYETKLKNYIDGVIYVYADEETRIRRTIERSKFGREEYKQRMKNQISSEYKIKMSKFIIFNNDGDDIKKQIEEINNTLNEI